MADVFVSIGSNIDKENNIPSAIKTLGAEFGDLIMSSIYRSQPVGFDGDDFFNMVVSFETQKTPRQIKEILNKIEHAHGRVRTQDRFISRSLDIDQILYGDLVCNEEDLCLPNRDIEKHAFILLPLAEIAGSRMHPISRRSYSEICDALGEVRKKVKKVMPPEMIL